MARIVTTEERIVSTNQWLTWLRIVGLGAAAGLAAWVITALIARYIIEPLACGQMVNATICLEATPIAGNIATILIVPLAILGMARLGILRPIIVAIAAGALLWPLAAWAEGLFWLEAIAWFITLYGLSYGLFSWIARNVQLWQAIVLCAAIVIAVRVAIIL
jgi:hypothetical protein